jgi:hypothetical protein
MIQIKNGFPRITINRSRMEVLQATLPSSIDLLKNLNKLDNIQEVDVKLNILIHLLNDVNSALEIIEQGEMEVEYE